MPRRKTGGAGRGVDQRGRSRRDAKHVRLYEFELASDAFRSLSPAGRALLIEFRRRYNGDHNRIHMSVRTAAKALASGKTTASRALCELLDRGLVRLCKKGRFTVRQGERDASEYALTNEPVGSEPASKDYMSWRPKNGDQYPKRDATLPHTGRSATATPPKTPMTVSETGHSSPKSTARAYPKWDTPSIPGGGAVCAPDRDTGYLTGELVEAGNAVLHRHSIPPEGWPALCVRVIADTPAVELATTNMRGLPVGSYERAGILTAVCAPVMDAGEPIVMGASSPGARRRGRDAGARLTAGNAYA